MEYNNFIPANPLVTPLHIAPVWYFTPYYSILRATTDPMIHIFTGLIGISVILAVLKGGFKPVAKAALFIAGLAAAGALLTFDAKFWGVVAMGGAVVIMFALPWLDRSPVKSIRYKPSWNKWLYGVFVINFFVLGYLGVKPPSDIGTLISQAGTLFYFGFFLLMPWWSRVGQCKTPPTRVTFNAH